MSKNLQLSLKHKWFEMTKSGIKTEDYREITPYWISRLVYKCSCIEDIGVDELNEQIKKCVLGGFKDFGVNIMTLGYPKKGDESRIIRLEHKGIEIREGNTEWGAEIGKLYFVIKHGEVIK